MVAPTLQAKQAEQVKLPIVDLQLLNQPEARQLVPAGRQPPGQCQRAIAAP